MPRLNTVLIFAAILLFALSSPWTLRDRIFVESLHLLEQKALVEPKPRELFEAAMTGMTDLLRTEYNDVYSGFIPNTEQQQYVDILENRFKGIGIQHRIDLFTERPVIEFPFPGTPAFKAGIQSGDTVLQVNDRDTKGLTVRQVSRLFTEPVTADEPSVQVTFKRFATGETVTKAITPGPILYESVVGDFIDTQGKRRFFLETQPDIAYVKITSFSDRTATELRQALQEINAASARGLVLRGLILDLRDNPGGFVPICVEIAGLFLSPSAENDVIVSTRFRDGKEDAVYHLKDGTKICDLPMVVLIDDNSASAAEILAAALQDYGRAKLVGMRTFGKGVVQQFMELPLNSGTLRLTGTSYWRPSNKNIHRHVDDTDADEWGVMPDEQCTVSASEDQQFAQMQIRQWRGNVISDKREELLKEWQQQIPKEIAAHHKRHQELFENAAEQDEKHESETPFESKSDRAVPAFALQGNAPYFDPQLDKAIDILRANTSVPTSQRESGIIDGNHFLLADHAQ